MHFNFLKLLRHPRFLYGSAFVCLGGLLWTGYANVTVSSYHSHTVNDSASLPAENACLVLGASKRIADGRPNLYYQYRMDATVQAYQAGKCRKIVVSGDNRRHDYNEPDDMKNSLVQRGIPATQIQCDYAGGRTLDSVLRFKRIFGQSSGIVISQAFHNERAIYIASHHDIRLTGFNAQEVEGYNGLRTRLREIFSRARAVADITLLDSQARHYGQPIPL